MFLYSPDEECECKKRNLLILLRLMSSFQILPLVQQDWERLQPSSLRGSRSHLMGSDTELSELDDDDRETVFSSGDMLSPSGHSDAQTLALMLQEQLDAINEEIR